MDVMFVHYKSLFCLMGIFINLFVTNICFKLRGVTISNWPYVERYIDNNGQTAYDGFTIELIDKIAKTSGFDYDLYESPDGRYGIYDTQSGRWDGMIGELIANRSDFAIGDLTISEERKRFVDFTKPFMSSGIAALIHKKYENHIQTFADLYYQKDLTYGLVLHSTTHHLFHHSNDSIIRKMYEKIDQNRDLFVRSRSEGIAKANTSAYAFISESASLEFTANVECELMVIYDKDNEFKDFQRDYGIALRKDSRYLNGFNWVIEQLNKSGELEDMRLQYWSSECESESEHEFDINSSLRLFPVISNFILFLISVLFLSQRFI